MEYRGRNIENRRIRKKCEDIILAVLMLEINELKTKKASDQKGNKMIKKMGTPEAESFFF